jgi:CRP-like cAMP-binding protein
MTRVDSHRLCPPRTHRRALILRVDVRGARAQLTDVCRRASYREYEAGAPVCALDDEVAYFHVVLGGTVILNEPVVHHLEQACAPTGATRERRMCAGHGFHHLPLITRAESYGYSVRVADGGVASLMLLSTADYDSILRRDTERDAFETVRRLAASNKLFASWCAHRTHSHTPHRRACEQVLAVRRVTHPHHALSGGRACSRRTIVGTTTPGCVHVCVGCGAWRRSEAALLRLHFYGERRHVGEHEDIVQQGDAATFCFLILSGSCRVLVAADTPKPSDEPRGMQVAAPVRASRRRSSLPNAVALAAAAAATTAAAAPTATGVPEGKPYPIVASPSAAPVVGTRSRARRCSAHELQQGVIDALGATAPRAVPRTAAVSGARESSFTRRRRALAANRSEVEMRHVATLSEGALLGEIALLSSQPDCKRTATVRAAEPAVILILDKKSFLELGQSTLHLIRESARCTGGIRTWHTRRTRRHAELHAHERARARARRRLSAATHAAHTHPCAPPAAARIGTSPHARAAPRFAPTTMSSYCKAARR